MSTATFYDDYWQKRPVRSTWDEARFKDVFGPIIGRESVLDYGCGMGHKYRAMLAKNVGSYSGADVSEVALNSVREAGHTAYSIDPSNSKIAAPDAAFDSAVCSEVFEHLFDPLAAVKEIHRVLKPGGVFVTTVPNFGYHTCRLMALLRASVPSEPDNIHENEFNGVHIRYFSTFSLERLLRAAGFVDVKVGSYMDSSIWDIFSIAGPFSRITRFAHRYLPAVAHLRFLERIWPSVFAIRIKAVARKP